MYKVSPQVNYAQLVNNKLFFFSLKLSSSRVIIFSDHFLYVAPSSG